MRSSAFARMRVSRVVFFSRFLLLLLALACPLLASAAVSVTCPTKSATVANGGTVVIDVSTCDDPDNFGLGTTVTPPSHGSIIVSTVNPQTVTYSHNGDSATSDTFVINDGQSPEGQITFTITISPPASAIVVSPASLPTLTAGAAFSQTLASSGGVAPYTYTLSSGTLPPGLGLSSAGVLSGTPTQRGGYSFSVRSQDSLGDFVIKGYTGTVQNPVLSISPVSATAIQGVAFAQTLIASGGVAPYSYLLETGSFPAGISISSAGVVSGTTAAATGSYPVTLRVTDSSTGAGSYFELESFTLDVSPPPSVSIAVAPASVSEDGATNLVYTVTRSLNLASPTTVNITTGGTATSGTDYTGGVATVTIPAGATTATITINPTADATVEADETVTLTVAAGTGYTVGAPSSATGTILNDDVPSASISVSPASVAEDGATNLVYTVTLSQAPLAPVSVNFNVSGTATSGVDFAAVTSPLVIAAGSTTGTITINPAADSTIEADETAILTLAAGTGYTVGAPASATGTILNDDLPNLTINDVTLAEGNAGTTSATFTVSLSAPAGPGGVTFDIATANGTATAGTDYVANSLTGQTIPAGSSTLTFTVLVNGDVLNEPTENFFVNVTNVTNAVVVDSQGLGTITNDDPLPTLSINNVSVVEGNSGTVSAAFTVSLSTASGQSVSVDYATADGTATAGSDYVAASGTLTFAPGQTSKTVSVTVTGDTAPESNETFTVSLSAAANATIAPAAATGTGTITNDDVPVTISPSSLPNATVATAYSQTLSASGGVASYSFALTAGALPAGLSLSSGGVLSGTPTAGGSFNFTVTATDSSGAPGPYSGSQAYTLVVNAPTLSLPATALAGGTLGQAYSASLNPAAGGTAPYSYAVTAGALPTGLALNAGSGAITGTASALGTFNFTVTAVDSSTGTGPYSGARPYAITVIDQPPVAGAVSVSIAYGSGASPVTLSLTGGAPTSVAIGAAAIHGTALASGTSITYQPNAGYAGSDSFTYTATNTGGTSAPATVSVTVGTPSITVTPSGGFAATVGIPYSQTFTWSGGAAPYSGYQVTGLPAGLSITGNTASSVTISGTPTAAGSFTLGASATDSSTGSGPFTVAGSFGLVVAAPSLVLTPAATTFAAPYGAAYSQSFTASGGIGSYTYATTGSLPPGTSFSGNTLSGTPTAPGSYAFSVTATDTGSSGAGSPFTVAQNYAVTVAAPVITILPATLVAGTAGTAYSASFSASGAVAPYSFAVTSGSLPPGLGLSAGGALTGTPSASGSFTFSVVATDSNGQSSAAGSYTLVLAVPSISLTPGTVPAGTAGTAYSQSFSASGGIAPYTIAHTAGALPAGLTFSAGALSGTPTQSGTFNFSITATDSTGGTAATVTNNYTLTVAAPTLGLTPATVPAGVAGNAYSQAFTASGGIAPYSYSLSAGALPAGLSLNAAGALTGTPTVAGTFSFSVTATDSTTGTAATITNNYSLVIAAPTITITPATLPGGIQSTLYQVSLSASGGTAPYSFAVTAGTLPAGLALSAGGILSGTPTAAGNSSFTVTATDGLGFTGVISYALTTAPRPDPSRDPEVRGLINAQVESAHRLAMAQINNFQQRMERMHGAREGKGFSNNLSMTYDRYCPMSEDGRRNPACDRPDASQGESGDATSVSHAASSEASFGIWTAGSIRFGSRDARSDSSGLDFRTDGVTVGADYRMDETFAFGAGVGYGREDGDVGNKGSQSKGDAYAFALYASYSISDLFFMDSMLGYQSLSYDLRRYVTTNGATVTGQRDGSQWLASVSVGADLQHRNLQLTPYVRLDMARAKLDSYREQGDAIYALQFDSMEVESSTANAGVRLGLVHKASWGVVTPELRLEYQQNLKQSSTEAMQYADLLSGTLYHFEPNDFEDNRFVTGVGASLTTKANLSFRIDYRETFLRDRGQDTDHSLQLNVEKRF